MNDPETGGPASSIEELLSLHDEEFIRCAFATVLGRDADPQGLSYFLARVRSGDSRRAILAAICLSPEGRRQEKILPGLDRLVRPYRWRRLPLLGPILHLIGYGEERFDVQRQLAAIQAQLSQLSHLARAPGAGTPVIGRRAPGHERPVRRSAPSTMAWGIHRNADGAEELSVIRVEMARALAELGVKVVPGAPDVTADMTAIFASPALAVDTRGGPTMLVGHDWEESGYPAEWVERVNDSLSGVACASSHAEKILVDHGVSVPVAAVGLGVDHWDRVFASPDYRAPGKRFRFLHVSSCGIGKGVDLLLESFARLFRDDDDVSLIIRPTGSTPREILALLERLRTSNPRFPHVVVIDEALTDADLKALYTQCHAFVAPSRAEGFGLPIAQALLAGVPVVATAWGGHCDYCDEANSWLVDYQFQPARTPDGPIASAWVEPLAKGLDEALRLAYRATPADRLARSSSGRERLMERFTWKEAALRLIGLAKRCKAPADAEPRRSRLGLVTTWNVRCGIASHVEHSVALLPRDDFVVFAARQNEPRLREDEPNCLRTWNSAKHENGFDQIERELAPRSVDTLVIQFNYGFYNHFELNAFIESVLAKGIVVFMELHSTVDPFGGKENYQLSDFLGALRKCHRILVHGPADMNRLKELGLVDNVMLFPLGVWNNGRAWALPAKHATPPLIASFGFCLAGKGLPELVEAVSLLKKEGTPARLLMLNAEHPSPQSQSAEEVARVKETIERLGLGSDIELHTEFLKDDVCLDRLGKADLVVNPYQSSGESASASVRFGIAAGRPVAVTPLPIFNDLGDAVFRMPGTRPHELARGISTALRHLEEGSESALRVRKVAREWVEAHDDSRQTIRLMRTARALARQRKTARGAFINTGKANCSIYESGRMVYNCINESDHYTLDYFSLDMIDVPSLVEEGKVRLLGGLEAGEADQPGQYDFWVFNWHFVTMAPHVTLESIAKLSGRKFSIILEVEPGNPLKLIPYDVFDGYIALDPTVPTVDRIFSFPRPLEGNPRRAGPPRDVPVIGSFGFGTPGKGFELLVEAVNREFDKAVVRINIPRGTYLTTDIIHWQDYSKYLAALCRKIAKPGIDVRFTFDFMSPEELVDWCGDNDLNCFMYTRRQPGLSATTDQAIMSGQPLLTGSNDTFRHIHRYIPPFPVIGLREAIASTPPMVRRMQDDWSRAAFSRSFERMLGTFGMVKSPRAGGEGSMPRNGRRPTILVAARRRASLAPGDIYWYSTRVANCLGRSGLYDIARVHCGDFAELKELSEKHRPDAVVVADPPGVGRDALIKALVSVTGPKVLLVDGGAAPAGDGLIMLPRQPVIPYFTSASGLRTGAPHIWLIGFAARDSNLEEVVAKIKREFPSAALYLEVPDARRPEFEKRVAGLREILRLARNEPLPLHALPSEGGEHLIAKFTANHMTVFYNDPERTEELESVCSLALTTERAIVFTRAAPLPYFGKGGTFIEDHSISDIIGLGMAAQIGLCHDYGEGALYARIHRLLTEHAVTG